MAAIVAPVSTSFANAPEAAKKTASSPAAGLYAALTQNQSLDVIAPLIEQAIRRAGHICAPLRDFQVFRAAERGQTLKAKCAEQPTYVLTVSARDEIRVAGGDGTVQPMNPQDGPIETVWGIRADRYLAQAAQSEAAQGEAAGAEAAATSEAAPVAASQRRGATAAGSVLPLQAGAAWGTTLGAGLLLAILLALPLLVWINARPTEAQGFTSHDKDLLLSESEEILPEIYQHPEGWFIVRGRRGKRRVFRVLIFAYLYRNYGFKLGEVR